MKVQDIMTASPHTCLPDANLAMVASQLWSHDCGALPVADPQGHVLGMITDRDICVALSTRNEKPAELTAEHVMSANVATCRPGDEVRQALETMRERQLHRLPVVDSEGKLKGILCTGDLLLNAKHQDGARPPLSYEDVIGTLKAIYKHPVNGNGSH
jgi:CBS domain-containing protein